MSIPMNYLD